MKLQTNKTFFLWFSDRINFVAALVFVFNFLNPHLASAATSKNFVAIEPTLKNHPASRLVRPSAKPQKIVAVITAYTSTADQTDDNPFITASGARVSDGTIAANGLPFGTVIKIPSLFGEKRFVVTDRMNSRYGFGRMDMWLDATVAEARKFGVKKVAVEIYYPEKILAKK